MLYSLLQRRRRSWCSGRFSALSESIIRSLQLGNATLSLLGLVYVPRSRQLVVFVFSILVSALGKPMDVPHRSGLCTPHPESVELGTGKEGALCIGVSPVVAQRGSE